MAIQIQLRRDTTANWTSENPTLAQGEIGLDLTSGGFKIGDGATAWASLPYHGGVAWGGITGTLSDQTDLQTALDAKGDKTLAINAQTGTTYTLVLSDASKLVTLSNSSAVTLTVPANSSVAFPVGTVIALAQLGTGLVTVEGDTGVTINSTTPGDDDLTGQWAAASLTKLATDTWLLSGGVA